MRFELVISVLTANANITTLVINMNVKCTDRTGGEKTSSSVIFRLDETLHSRQNDFLCVEKHHILIFYSERRYWQIMFFFHFL